MKTGLQVFNKQVPKVSMQLSDLIVNNSSAEVDTDIFFEIKLNKSYRIEIYSSFESSVVAGVKYQLKGDPTPSIQFGKWSPILGDINVDILTAIAGAGFGAGVVNGDTLNIAIGRVVTAGKFKLAFAQNSKEVSDTIFKKGSFAVIYEDDFRPLVF